MSKGFQDLVSCLENRYDFHSARVVASEALLSTGLAEADTYKPAELQKLADAVAVGARHMDKVWLALEVAPSGTAMPEAPVIEAADDAPAAEEPAEAEKAPAKKPAKKAPAKKAKAKK